MRRVLAATDGSEGAARALDVAAQITRAFQASLRIVHVTPDNLTSDQIRALGRLGMSEGEALEVFSEQILNQARARAREIGVSEILTQWSVGDAAEKLLEIAREEHVDAIVAGRRGRGRLAGLLLGSVSQKLASLAPCTVVVVP
jgi:nucleotide-binding universal stress UspA family protein